MGDRDGSGEALRALTEAVTALTRGQAALQAAVDDIARRQQELSAQLALIALQLGQVSQTEEAIRQEVHHLEPRPIESCGSCGSPLSRHEAASGMMLACEVCGWTGFLEKDAEKE